MRRKGIKRRIKRVCSYLKWFSYIGLEIGGGKGSLVFGLERFRVRGRMVSVGRSYRC